MFDCLRASGLRNLLWRTPGADGGRDIEGWRFVNDFSGQDTSQKWFIECKRYSNSLDWPTVWKKIAYADGHLADYLLVATNSNPSPACENEIARWNEGRRTPIIRFWRGYDLPRIIRSFPHIAVAYGLATNIQTTDAAALSLSAIVTGITQAAYVSHSLGGDVSLGLEAGSYLSELLSHRLSDLERFGRFVPGAELQSAPAFDWLDCTGDVSCWEDVGFRATLTYLRYQTQCERIIFSPDHDRADVRLVNARLPLSETAKSGLQLVGEWARIEVSGPQVDAVDHDYLFSQRGN